MSLHGIQCVGRVLAALSSAAEAQTQASAHLQSAAGRAGPR